MKIIQLFFFVFFFSANANLAISQKMTLKKIDKVLSEVSDSISGADGFWEFSVDQVTMLCIADEMHGRIRIISPIKVAERLTETEVKKSLEANFFSALDVRYAVSEEILWAAFIHPLDPLKEGQLVDAVSQVYNAALTFGTSYSSTDLEFPRQPPKPKKDQKELKKL